ncbi:CAMP-specific 3',5'-cyclic phosphodiesterase 4B [Giardia lamblia P15]|uniref:Phosphodiesterase n=1 Tax=Giardia intestinalis (strain P15) TaxID=658858 RepID=E1EWX9_GIAIA|nr:CAMP-specific 3',5'-cyclic phosphodiesterase 4B [Giardia lamblia P15]
MISLCLAAGSLLLAGSILIRLCSHSFIVNVHNLSTMILGLFSLLFLTGFLFLSTGIHIYLGISVIVAGRAVSILACLHLLSFWCLITVTFQTRLYFLLLSSTLKLLPIVTLFGLMAPILLISIGVVSVLDSMFRFTWVPFFLILCTETANYFLFKYPDRIMWAIMQKIVRTTSLQTSSERLSVVALLLPPETGKECLLESGSESDIQRAATRGLSNLATSHTHVRLKKTILDDLPDYSSVITNYEPTYQSVQKQLDESINLNTPTTRSSFAAIVSTIRKHRFAESPPINFFPHIEPTMFYLVLVSLLFIIALSLNICYKYLLRERLMGLLPQLIRFTHRSIEPDHMTSSASIYTAFLELINNYSAFPAMHAILILQMIFIVPLCNGNAVDVMMVFTNPVIFQVFARWLESNRFGAPLAFLIDCYFYRQRPSYERMIVNKIYVKWIDMLANGMLPCTGVALSEVEFLVSRVMSAGLNKHYFNDMTSCDNMLSILDSFGTTSSDKLLSKIRGKRGPAGVSSIFCSANTSNHQLNRSLSTDFVINMDVFTAIEIELSIVVYICAIKFLYSLAPIYFRTLTYLSTLESHATMPCVLFRLDNMERQGLMKGVLSNHVTVCDPFLSKGGENDLSTGVSSKSYCNIYLKMLFKSLQNYAEADLRLELTLLAILNKCSPNILFSAVTPRTITKLSEAHKKSLLLDQLTLLSNISVYNMSLDSKQQSGSTLLASQNLILKNLAHTRARRNSLIGPKTLSSRKKDTTLGTSENTKDRSHITDNTLFSYFDSSEEKLVTLLKEILRTRKLDTAMRSRVLTVCQLLDPDLRIHSAILQDSKDASTKSEDWGKLLNDIKGMKLMSLTINDKSEINEQLRALDEGRYEIERPQNMRTVLSYSSSTSISRQSVEDMLQLYSKRYPEHIRMPDVSQREFRVNNTYYRLDQSGELVLTLQQRILQAVLNIAVIRTLEYFETGDENAMTLTVTSELAEKYRVDCSNIKLAVEYNLDKISKYICQNIESSSFDVNTINTYTRTYGLTAVGYILAKLLGITTYFSIHDNVLLAVLIELESSYTSTLYHNKLHAADVAQMSMYMLSNVYCSLINESPKHPFLCVHKAMLRYKESDYSRLIAEQPRQALIRPVDFLALLFGSLCHDLGHTGIDNLFCINTENALALLYNDEAPLEHAHATLSWHILTQMAIYFKHFTPGQYREFRALFLEIILATDMSTHFNFLRRLESISKDIIVKILEHHNDSEIALLRWYILKVCIKFGDLSNPCRPIEISTRYAVALMNEFWSLGDLMLECGLEPDKIKTRPQKGEESLIIANLQIGFTQNIVKGFWTAVERFWKALADVEFKDLQANLNATVEHWQHVRSEIELDKKE